MMNGHEKSGPVIVAVKPTNKAEPSAAEPGEPRAGTEGNADQDDTLRTPSREGASHGLERVRKTARERKKERFTALFHHIDTELLGAAFAEIKEDAAPGVDQLRWTDYEADLERNLE
jgi:RNA-directed DNA polymerase